jgi:cytochrome c-type biogenesis protein CcmH/NrfG
MPFTYNGIGTRYVGGSNQSAHAGICEFCKNSASLSSYDTREWFCFVYIPIIPLTKYRIMNMCSRCRKHMRLSHNDFRQQVDARIAPLREAIRLSPRDPEPQIALVQTLIGWELSTEAERAVETALSTFPSNVDLLLLRGELASNRNDYNTALAAYEKARALDPQNGAATYGYAWVLVQTGRNTEAIPVLQQASQQDFNRVGALYLLGTTLINLGRTPEALQALQQIISLDSKYLGDKKLLRLIAGCKKKLGYQLTEAERRAGRSWWPFEQHEAEAREAPGDAVARAAEPAYPRLDPSRVRGVRPGVLLLGPVGEHTSVHRQRSRARRERRARRPAFQARIERDA